MRGGRGNQHLEREKLGGWRVCGNPKNAWGRGPALVEREKREREKRKKIKKIKGIPGKDRTTHQVFRFLDFEFSFLVVISRPLRLPGEAASFIPVGKVGKGKRKREKGGFEVTLQAAFDRNTG